jgi:hypothetical protein
MTRKISRIYISLPPMEPDLWEVGRQFGMTAAWARALFRAQVQGLVRLSTPRALVVCPRPRNPWAEPRFTGPWEDRQRLQALGIVWAVSQGMVTRMSVLGMYAALRLMDGRDAAGEPVDARPRGYYKR